MKYIEFNTSAKDGVIKVPAKHRKRLAKAKKLRIRIAVEESPQAADGEIDMIDYLIKNPVERSGPLMKRDELYDRRL